MSDTMGSGSAPKKKSKFPTWGYLVAAVGVAGAYYLYKRNQAAAASTSSMSTATPVAAAGSGTSTSGATVPGYGIPGYGGTGNGAGTTSTPSTTTTFTPPPGAHVVSSGTGTQYEVIQNSKDLGSYIAGGGTAYYQPVPGIFQPWRPGLTNGQNIPIYAQVP